MKSFQNNKSPVDDGLPAEFYKNFNEIPKTGLHKWHIESSQLGEMPRSIWKTVISPLQKRRRRGHNSTMTTIYIYLYKNPNKQNTTNIRRYNKPRSNNSYEREDYH